MATPKQTPEVFTRRAQGDGVVVHQTVEVRGANDPQVEEQAWVLNIGPFELTTRHQPGLTVNGNLEVVKAKVITTEIRIRS